VLSLLVSGRGSEAKFIFKDNEMVVVSLSHAMGFGRGLPGRCCDGLSHQRSWLSVKRRPGTMMM